MKEVIARLFGDPLPDVVEVETKMRKVDFRLILLGITYLHPTVSIFRVFLFDVSRPIRFTMAYIQLILIIAL